MTKLLTTQLQSWILKRVGEASGPYQMFEVLGDVILLRGWADLINIQKLSVQEMSDPTHGLWSFIYTISQLLPPVCLHDKIILFTCIKPLEINLHRLVIYSFLCSSYCGLYSLSLTLQCSLWICGRVSGPGFASVPLSLRSWGLQPRTAGSSHAVREEEDRLPGS